MKDSTTSYEREILLSGQKFEAPECYGSPAKDISMDDIEIRAIGEAYDALKCLDMVGTQRALAWLESKFHDKFTAPKRSTVAADYDALAKFVWRLHSETESDVTLLAIEEFFKDSPASGEVKP